MRLGQNLHILQEKYNRDTKREKHYWETRYNWRFVKHCVVKRPFVKNPGFVVTHSNAPSLKVYNYNN